VLCWGAGGGHDPQLQTDENPKNLAGEGRPPLAPRPPQGEYTVLLGRRPGRVAVTPTFSRGKMKVKERKDLGTSEGLGT
jgi:hypothetical protein